MHWWSNERTSGWECYASVCRSANNSKSNHKPWWLFLAHSVSCFAAAWFFFVNCLAVNRMLCWILLPLYRIGIKLLCFVTNCVKIWRYCMFIMNKHSVEYLWNSNNTEHISWIKTLKEVNEKMKFWLSRALCSIVYCSQ